MHKSFVSTLTPRTFAVVHQASSLLRIGDAQPMAPDSNCLVHPRTYAADKRKPRQVQSRSDNAWRGERVLLRAAELFVRHMSGADMHRTVARYWPSGWRLTSNLSMRVPSMSTTSIVKWFHSTRSPSTGICSRMSSTSPPTVW